MIGVGRKLLQAEQLARLLRRLGLLLGLLGGCYFIAILVRDALLLDQVLGPVAQNQSIMVRDLSTLRRELLRVQLELQQLQTNDSPSLESMRQQYAIARSSFEKLQQLRRDASDRSGLSAESLALIDRLQVEISAMDQLLAELQHDLTLQQRSALLARLRGHLQLSDELASELVGRQTQSELAVLEEARGIVRSSRTALALAGALLLLMGSLLVLLIRRTLLVQRRANEQFQLAAAAVNSAIYDWDVTRDWILWTDGLRDVFGYRPDEVEPTLGWWLAQIHPDDQQRVALEIDQSVAQGQDFTSEYRFRDRAGQYRNVLDRGCVMRNSSGRTIRMVGSLIDITARKQAEEALAAEKERLAVTLSSIGEGVIATDNERRIVLINKVAETLTGWSSAEALGRPLREVYRLTSNRPRQSQEQGASAALAGVELPDLGRHSVLIARDNTRRIVADSGAPILDQAGRIIGVVLVFRDITEHQMLERQLQQAQKMESIGALAGGIAHDFNNILTGIIGYVDLALMSLTSEQPLWEDLQAIKKQSEYATSLTRQLLAFSRRQPIEPRLVQLNQIVEETEKFLRRIIGEHIELVCTPDACFDSAYVDPAQVQQVLMNLCLNARDAMPQGGRLQIGTSDSSFDEHDCLTRPWARPGRYVGLSVSDTGVGIAPETLQHIFEPFFTTKEQGKGTGLGLAMVYGIVQQHGALISVSSEPGRGTCFAIYFQRAQSQRAPGQPAQQVPDVKLLNGQETILVTEAEAPVREVIVRTLEALGYRVLSAADSNAVAELCQRMDSAIDLVLLDPALLKQSPTIEQTLRAQPGSCKVLYIAGERGNGLEQLAHGQASPPLLHKPFSTTELARRVREVLDS